MSKTLVCHFCKCSFSPLNNEDISFNTPATWTVKLKGVKCKIRYDVKVISSAGVKLNICESCQSDLYLKEFG